MKKPDNEPSVNRFLVDYVQGEEEALIDRTLTSDIDKNFLYFLYMTDPLGLGGEDKRVFFPTKFPTLIEYLYLLNTVIVGVRNGTLIRSLKLDIIENLRKEYIGEVND